MGDAGCQVVLLMANHRLEGADPGIHQDEMTLQVGNPETMPAFTEALTGAQIHSVLVDSEVTYIMLSNGTQVTIRGIVVVQPRPVPPEAAASMSAGSQLSRLPRKC